MVRIGIAGIGFMGMTHFRGVKKVKGAKVSAICTRDPRKLKGDWRGIHGNFGDPGGIENLAGIRTYSQIDDLLTDPQIDLVDICLPTGMHCDVSIRALRAGKHVLLEKPIALDTRDAERMLREAERAGRLLMVAHVLAFFPEYVYLRDLVSSGTHGGLVGGHFKRIISKPDWSADFDYMDRTGGPGVDLHIHDTHFILLLCGVPDRVSTVGKLIDGRYADYLCTAYRYNDLPDLSVTCASGAICQPGRRFNHGFEVYLERATVLYEFSTLDGKPVVTTPLTVLTPDGKLTRPRLGSGDPVVAFTREIQAAVDAMSKGSEAPELSGRRAADALRLCFKEVESARRGQAVRIP
ncbi:MAG: Gfo/Idh/MocA family oxidoreductase [Candidatus Latescibacteria bacterium]|jgi:predicted dehydrogenase|nr:Gfo/Idh/MocA family oxidoreductase [Candidatus Latescibacterota bacterium]